MAHAPDHDRDDLAALLALTEVPGIGAGRLRALIAAFGSALGAMRAPRHAVAAVPGCGRAAAAAVCGASLARGRTILETVERITARILQPSDDAFPPLLREIPDPPPVLFVWGDADLLQRPAVAIVGSRDHSPYGAEAARVIAAGVARAGAAVVSGMARGIDAVAHTAALDVGGRSVGVLGNGFGVVYPAANRVLYERMARDGCLVTEFPPGERPHAGAFPRRNRLISGLASVTVVVEAAPPSGALQTADCALDQGRAVLAVPGPITSPMSLGPNKLIQQGAKPALSAADILEELRLPAPGALAPAPSREPPKAADLTPLERMLWTALATAPLHVDALVSAVGAEAGAGAGAVLTTLTELELRGIVTQRPGMVFALGAT